MPDYNRVQPIHPADCACPRCEPRLLTGRRRLTLEHALMGLILAASFVGAGIAIIGTN